MPYYHDQSPGQNLMPYYHDFGHGSMASGSGHGSGHGSMASGSGHDFGHGSGSGSGGELPIELPGGSGSGGENPIELPEDGEQPLELIEEQYEQPLELIEDGEVPVEIPDAECCSEKTVGGIHYYLVGTGETEVYNCLDNCIYHSENPRDVWQYCFRVGRQPVQCNDATVTPSAGHHHPTGAPMMDHHDMMEHDMMEHDMMEHGIHH